MSTSRASNAQSLEDQATTFKTSAISAFASQPLTQLGSGDACVLSFGSGDRGCTRSRQFRGPTGIAITPDGRHALATSYFSGAVVLLRRDRVTQALRRVPGTGDASWTGAPR